jgi:uncharacterized membrane protein (DUF2068 family)
LTAVSDKAVSLVPVVKKRAPTLYAIIAMKLLKASLFIGFAIAAYTLSDNDLPYEYRRLLHFFGFKPEWRFFADLATQLGKLTEANVLWTAAGTLVYSLFSLVEGLGLMFRVSWAGWMAIGESAFFIPIEVYELVHHRFSLTVLVILVVNVIIVWYLLRNRERLFTHAAHLEVRESIEQ